mmetsp:Transcript_10991/g.16186  ORF Transcript_10991/g.16186 Transcript_10991/m.16186 type:complete len:257 (-) Transcript_10991:514-1284(-)
MLMLGVCGVKAVGFACSSSIGQPCSARLFFAQIHGPTIIPTELGEAELGLLQFVQGTAKAAQYGSIDIECGGVAEALPTQRVKFLPYLSAFYRKQVQGNPVVIESLNCCLRFMLGDMIAHLITSGHVDLASMLQQSFYGLLLNGAMNYYWYTGLEAKIPGSSVKSILGKLLADQLLYSPVSNAMYLVFMGACQGAGIRGVAQKVAHSFVGVYGASLSVWVVAQLVNFVFIAPSHRTLYINVVGFLWTILLSMLNGM